MGRSPCCSKEGLNRGAWTAMEDKRLSDYIKIHGEGKWRNLPKRAGLNRCGKSCRLRWLNYLRPGIKRGNITHDEEELIIRLHNLLGNRWSLIAGRLPGRTDNEIKNYWNTIIGKKLQNHQQNPQLPSSDHTPLNQAEDILIPTIGKHKALPSKVNNVGDANVVRTRASRCNKVVIPPELHNDDWKQLYDTNLTVAPTSRAPENNQLVPESLVLGFNSDENNSSDLMMNFEMDGQFLSDLLNTDFSQLTSFDNGAASDSASTIDQGYLSPNSSQTLLFTDDAMQEPKFSPIDSLIESEFDWLVD